MDKLQTIVIDTLIENTIIEYNEENGITMIEYPFNIILESDNVTTSLTPLLRESCHNHLRRIYGMTDEVYMDVIYRRIKLYVRKKKLSIVEEHRKKVSRPLPPQNWKEVFSVDYNPCGEINLD